jgi:NAD(P)-dependent dehydrogenase (short-subunit alcohol dehydrogenase family)
MTARLDGQVILITGSTAGIGRAMAERFASSGARVVITGRSVDRGRSVEQLIRSNGGEALFVPMDIGEEAQVQAAVAAAEQTFGKLTGLVNNAATIQGRKDGPITEIETDDWLNILRVDLTGTYFALKYGLRAIARAGGGSVVNISSTAGVRGQIGNNGYAACKGAIQALTRSLAVYYSRYLIRVNCLIVGTIDTGEGKLKQLLDSPDTGPKLIQQYLGRVGRPVEVADAAAFLLSNEASFINGVELPVDNGATMKGHAINKPRDMAGIAAPPNPWV